MSVSLNEVEAIAKKATRGAGYSWGMAEEAGRATRWLCAQGFDGCASLAALLGRTEGAELANLTPRAFTGEWDAPSGALCPILAGAALSDCAARLKQAEIQMVTVVEPIMILPFAATTARQLGTTINVEWPGLSATTNGAEISVSDGASMAATKVGLKIREGGALGRTAPRQTRAAPQAADWDRLQLFASRTHAPATEESRILGAGGDVSDND